MGTKLNLFLLLPLREMALRKIAVVLVNKPEFLPTIEEYSFEIADLYQDEWMVTFSRKIKDAVSKLPLPPSLLKEMTPLLKAVGFEILKWKLIHKPHLAEFEIYAINSWKWYKSPYFCDSNRDFDPRVFEKLCWTTTGTIDYRKTSEKLVHSDVVNKVQRIKLACLYCLEDCIPDLWNELPELKRKSMFFDDRGSRVRVREPHLLLFLPYILKRNAWRNIPPLETIRDDCLKYSALLGNKSLTEYCLSKLSEENREAVVFQTAVDVVKSRDVFPPGVLDPVEVKRPEVFRYLLSLMSSENQLRIFKEYPCEILLFFFDWPWQDLCLEIAEVVWPFFPEIEYEWLLRMLKNYLRRPGYHIPKFFQDFFLLSPMKFRKYLLDDECQDAFFLTTFFRAEDSGSIRLIFKNMDPVHNKRLFVSEKFIRLCDDFLLRDGWHIVKDCIPTAMLSNEGRDRLKAFEKNLTIYNSRKNTDLKKNKRKGLLHRMNWKRKYERVRKVNKRVRKANMRKILFYFLDKINATTAKKRCADVETITPVKKLRTS